MQRISNTITMSEHAMDLIIRLLVKDGEFLKATMVIKQVYDCTIKEAIDFYKSLPEYQKIIEWESSHD